MGYTNRYLTPALPVLSSIVKWLPSKADIVEKNCSNGGRNTYRHAVRGHGRRSGPKASISAAARECKRPRLIKRSIAASRSRAETQEHGD